MEFFRFPHTPHLAWLGPGQPRDDKVLAAAEAQELLARELVVEEKIDGANLGFSTSEDGELLAQNRGSYLTEETAHAQFRPLWSWLRARRAQLVDALWPDRMLFGEWCYAVHSVQYDALPDWFLGFDVYDRTTGGFWDTSRRDTLLAELGLHPTPRVATGRFALEGLRGLLGRSNVGGDWMEGVVVRHEHEGLTTRRAKLVRPEFTQAIDAHWSRGRLVPNRLAAQHEVTASWH
jgi:ATP-dependent RNA circularization protein (DNA/RNA ligase family)